MNGASRRTTPRVIAERHLRVQLVKHGKLEAEHPPELRQQRTSRDDVLARSRSMSPDASRTPRTRPPFVSTPHDAIAHEAHAGRHGALEQPRAERDGVEPARRDECGARPTVSSARYGNARARVVAEQQVGADRLVAEIRRRARDDTVRRVGCARTGPMPYDDTCAATDLSRATSASSRRREQIAAPIQPKRVAALGARSPRADRCCARRSGASCRRGRATSCDSPACPCRSSASADRARRSERHRARGVAPPDDTPRRRRRFRLRR